MYIYKIEVLVKWNYHSKNEDIGEDESVELNVSGKNFTQAMGKVEKIVLAKSLTWKDTDDDGTVHVWYPEYIADVISVERKDRIDA